MDQEEDAEESDDNSELDEDEYNDPENQEIIKRKRKQKKHRNRNRERRKRKYQRKRIAKQHCTVYRGKVFLR